MPNFRVYFLNIANDVVATELIGSGTDAQAHERAGKLLAASDHSSVEVWDGPWKVYRVNKPGT